MKKYFKTTSIVVIASVIALAVANVIIPLFNEDSKIDNHVSLYGFLLNDDLVAIRNDDHSITIKNSVTGEITAENIKLDWSTPCPYDSLGVFCSNNKRGFYNSYTGHIAIPAQYRRAWFFSEGLAAVQKDGMIGFINKKGETVIDFKYPYHGNSLCEFIFEHGYCVVADTLGNCGVINKKGEWVINPEYKNITTFNDYVIASKPGAKHKIDYNGNMLNALLFDYIETLTYTEEVKIPDSNGRPCLVKQTVNTGLFAYFVGGYCGLMDSDCRRLTQPLYTDIRVYNNNLFCAQLDDHSSIVLLNRKGEFIQ